MRGLPSAAIQPVLIVPDTTPSTDREDLLNALADEGARDPIVRRTAIWLATRCALAHGRQPTDRQLAQCLLDGLHELVQYSDDPDDREEYNRAVTTLSSSPRMERSPITGSPKGTGDCEDLAVLYASLARALGLRSQVVWIDQPRGAYNHVAAAVCDLGAGCEWVETTLPGARVGENPYTAAERLGITHTLGVHR